MAQGYLIPLRNGNVLPREDLPRIFGNIELLLSINQGARDRTLEIDVCRSIKCLSAIGRSLSGAQREGAPTQGDRTGRQQGWRHHHRHFLQCLYRTRTPAPLCCINVHSLCESSLSRTLDEDGDDNDTMLLVAIGRWLP